MYKNGLNVALDRERAIAVGHIINKEIVEVNGKTKKNNKRNRALSNVRVKVEGLQKEYLCRSEETFNADAIKTINEICSEGDFENKKFLTEVFQCIHDNIYGTLK